MVGEVEVPGEPERVDSLARGLNTAQQSRSTTRRWFGGSLLLGRPTVGGLLCAVIGRQQDARHTVVGGQACEVGAPALRRAVD